MEINNKDLRSYFPNDKTFIIEFHSGIGNSLSGFFYGLYIYSLFNLDKTHKLIIITIPNHRGFYSFSDFFTSNDNIKLLKVDNYDEKSLFPDNYVTINCNILYTLDDNLHDLKTILYKINPIPENFYEDKEIIYRLKIICKQLNIKLKNNIKYKLNNFLNINFKEENVFGIHIRSTDSKHNKGKMQIGNKIIEPFKLIETTKYTPAYYPPEPELGSYLQIEYKGYQIDSKIVIVNEDKSFSVIFDNSSRNNISKIFNVKSKNEFIIDLSTKDKKYMFSKSKIMTVTSVNHLLYNLKFLSSTTKLINISKDRIIEKIFKPNKDFEVDDIIEVNENKNIYTAEITSINYKNKNESKAKLFTNIIPLLAKDKSEPNYNIIYHDYQMLNTIEKNPNITNFIIKNIRNKLSNNRFTKIFICSDDNDIEYNLNKYFSNDYECFSFNKKEKVTKVPGLEDYPWYIDDDIKEEILEKVKNGLLKTNGGPANNGVLIGIPYNTTCNKEQLVEALIDSIILSHCSEINKSWNGSTFSSIGYIIKNLGFLSH